MADRIFSVIILVGLAVILVIAMFGMFYLATHAW